MENSVASLAYAAGLFDGEGSVSITHAFNSAKTKRYHVLHVSLTSTTPVMLDWLKDQFGGHITKHAKREAWQKPSQRWQMDGKAAAEFLTVIEPYLVVKTRQVAVALKFRQTLRGYDGSFGRQALTPEIEAQRDILRQELLELNRRGVAIAAEVESEENA